MSTINFDIDNILIKESDSDRYSEFFATKNDSFNNPLIIALENVYNNMISNFPIITRDQEFVLAKIFNRFKYVQLIIDPNRLKNFSITATEDDDIVLFRNTEENLINIIIHPEDDFALSIINKVKGSSLEFYDNDSADYEKLVYEFLK